MKLDKRIDKDKIYSCFDTEQSKEYINTKGYFTDCYENFNDIRKLFYGTLENINNNSVFSYFNSERKETCRFFLPEKFVKSKEDKKEKELRPYTLSEFLTIFPIGEIIIFRYKRDKSETYSIFLGYEKRESGDIYIEIGSAIFTLESLFKNYEWQKFPEEEYRPFGVEE